MSDSAVYVEIVVRESASLSDSPLISFSLDAIRQLVRTRDDLLRQYEEASRKVDALSVLVPEHLRDSIFGTSAGSIAPSSSPTVDVRSKGHVSAPSWQVVPPMSEFIVAHLDEALKVFEQDQIEEAIWLNPHYNDKSIYSAESIGKTLEKLSRRGRIGKRGMRYYSKNATNIPETSFKIEGPTVIKAVEKVLRNSDESLEAWEVINRIKDDPEIGEKVRNNQNNVYAALSRLTSRRIAYRDADGGYRIGAK